MNVMGRLQEPTKPRGTQGGAAAGLFPVPGDDDQYHRQNL